MARTVYWNAKTVNQEGPAMSLGSSLYHARKKSGLSQENVAEKLGVSRQTISKWETNEMLPDIRQSKRLTVLYHLTLDKTAAVRNEQRLHSIFQYQIPLLCCQAYTHI